MDRIFLSAPHMSGHEMDYIKDAFRTNWVAPNGPNVDHFEQEFAAYIGRPHAVALATGTAALHLALQLLGVGKGDTVLVSSLTFIGSVSPVAFLGAKPVFIDSDPESWNMSPQALASALKDLHQQGVKPKAVVIVNLYGQSARYNELIPICREYDVPVVEDAAESLGALYEGKQTGNFGLLSIFSFNGNKIITTSGGGMLVTDRGDWAEKARFLSTQARDPAPHYQHSEIGYNYRLSNILAGIGRAQLQVVDARVEARRRVFAYYKEHLPEPFYEFMPEISNGCHNRWLTTLTLGSSSPHTSAALLASLSSQNIESRPVWKPMHLQPVFAGSEFYPHAHDVAKDLFTRGICLPSSSFLTEPDLARVVAALRPSAKSK